MAEKVIVILVDGMRADAPAACGHPFVDTCIAKSAYAAAARTVFPSVTLPCHMSLFHSVTPDRHGILSNTWMPQVRPVKGLVEQLDDAGRKCAFFITWEELRDLSRPDHLTYSCMYNQHKYDDSDDRITEYAIDYINREQPDFVFLYLGQTDEKGGHDTGWMSETYLQVVNNAWNDIEKVFAQVQGYNIIVTADHGGHDRHHGTDMPEDMTIPMFLSGPAFKQGAKLENVSILDIAPTVAKLLEAAPAKEWEGRVLTEALV